MGASAFLPMVLMTGQLLTDAVWQPLLPEFGERDILFADNRHAETVADLADNLLRCAPARFDLIGHAMGGFVAFEVMRRAPERVAHLVLISTLASADGPAQTARRQGYIDLVEDGRFEAVVEERIPLLFPENKRSDPELLALARGMARDTGAETFLAQQRAIMARPDSRPTLGDIRVPTLLIWGDGDGITTRAHQEEMLAGISGACLQSIAAAGHLPMVEEAATCAAHIIDFLDI